jgi:Tol biopolymer transport system component
MLSVSANALAFTSSAIPFGSHLAVISRDGNGLQILSDPQLGGFLRLSPDGRRLVRVLVDPLAGNPDLWVEDLERHTLLRITTGRDFDVLPTWSPDGLRLVYRSGSFDNPELRLASADGTGISSVLPCPRGICEPTDWSVDGRLLLVNVGTDVWIVPVDRKDAPRPLLDSSFTERDARFSPDSRWIAYVSDESGRPEVSVLSVAASPRRVVVTSGGGDQPVWRRDGKELFYANADGLLHSVSVRFDREGNPVFGQAARLNVPRLGVRHWGTEYDVSPDGARVYFPKPPEARAPREVRVVLGWNKLLD